MKIPRAIYRWFRYHPGWKVGSPLGVPLFVKPSVFVTLVCLSLYLSIEVQTAFGVALWVFHAPSVLLHEYGHVWMMKRLGYEPSKVEYVATGGLATYGSGGIAPPEHALKISTAGPLVSLMLCLLLSAGIALPPGPVQDAILFGAVLNATAACVNMLPFLPLDGGRFHRALLRKYKNLSYVEATRRVTRSPKELDAAASLEAQDQRFAALIKALDPDDLRRYIVAAHQKTVVFAAGAKNDALWERFQFALEATAPPKTAKSSAPSYAEWYEAHKHEW